MPPTKHMTGNIFKGHVQDAMFNLVGILTDQGMQLLGMMTEAMHTPHIHDRQLAIENRPVHLQQCPPSGGGSLVPARGAHRAARPGGLGRSRRHAGGSPERSACFGLRAGHVCRREAGLRRRARDWRGLLEKKPMVTITPLRRRSGSGSDLPKGGGGAMRGGSHPRETLWGHDE